MELQHTAGAMAEAATAFRDSLDDERREAATFAFDDPERFDWHFIPRKRNGLALRDMESEQKQLAYALVSTALSGEGFRRAMLILSLERILWEKSNHNKIRDPEWYCVSIFGEPGPTGPWGWRFEGHHISLNLTVRDGVVVSATPFFFGTNPALVLDGTRKGLRTLEGEELIARDLVQSFDASQRAAAWIQDEAFGEFLSVPENGPEAAPPAGIGFNDLTGVQRSALGALVDTYLRRLPDSLSAFYRARMRKVDAMRFGWAGGTDAFHGHYYRITGDGWLFEYVNTQNGANHIHTAWHDRAGNFGGG